MPLRGDRILRYVSAFCPHCYYENPERPLEQVRRLGGYLSADDDGQVWLVRGCPDHGMVDTLYDESSEILTYLEQWTAPTRRHTPDLFGNFDQVPHVYLRGLGEMQTQHTCTLLEDIEQGCNLCCPNCFAASSPQLRGTVPVDVILANVDTRIAREGGRIDVLMLSGGEPTLHPQLIPLLDALIERPVVRILINTNGIEIAQNDALLAYLQKQRKRIEVYLQFDGFKLETHRYHRGADLRKVKEQAIKRLSTAGIFTTLTMTAALGVNDDEIGAVIQYALETPFVGGVSIQPQFGSGRATPIDPSERLTHTGTLARFSPQTGGLVSWHDMIALPCSHPHCCSVGYMLLTDKGEWKSLAAIIGHENLKTHLGLVSNRIVDPELSAQLRDLVKESLFGLFSEQSSLSHPQIGTLFRNICETCDIGMSTLLRMAGDAMLGRQDQLRELLARRVKRITIKPFMDINTMLEERLTQCCVHVGTQSATGAHQCTPFCAAQAWPALSRQKLSERAGHS
ncbi:MAG: radical SAM protein [Oscillochloris sp.]|nr:radical SAM protein [Oscillochloris sp.]